MAAVITSNKRDMYGVSLKFVETQKKTGCLAYGEYSKDKWQTGSTHRGLCTRYKPYYSCHPEPTLVGEGSAFPGFSATLRNGLGTLFDSRPSWGIIRRRHGHLVQPRLSARLYQLHPRFPG